MLNISKELFCLVQFYVVVIDLMYVVICLTYAVKYLIFITFPCLRGHSFLGYPSRDSLHINKCKLYEHTLKFLFIYLAVPGLSYSLQVLRISLWRVRSLVVAFNS